MRLSRNQTIIVLLFLGGFLILLCIAMLQALAENRDSIDVPRLARATIAFVATAAFLRLFMHGAKGISL